LAKRFTLHAIRESFVFAFNHFFDYLWVDRFSEPVTVSVRDNVSLAGLIT
jgi:hypothetical protein